MSSPQTMMSKEEIEYAAATVITNTLIGNLLYLGQQFGHQFFKVKKNATIPMW